MKYNCGHEGCDICGARTCTAARLKKYGELQACDNCVILAVKVAVNMSETFGGTIIDPSRKCGVNKKESNERE